MNITLLGMAPIINGDGKTACGVRLVDSRIVPIFPPFNASSMNTWTCHVIQWV